MLLVAFMFRDSMTESRLSAIACLNDILKKKGKPKHSLDQFSQTLDRRDRAFVMEIVYGVLRHLFVLDWTISSFVRDISPLRDGTINNLRIALYQMLFMRVPDFAVVHEAVEIEKKGGKPSLTNAVLRNVIRSRETLKFPIPFDDPARDISVNTSHPEWMVRRWIKTYGIDEARSLAEANNSLPPLILRTNTLKISRDDLLELFDKENIPAKPTSFSPEGIVMDRSVSYQDIAGFYGLFAIQDEASQLVSHLLSPRQGERVLDACAAPGGKTTHIAQLMEDRGEIVAVEKDPLRTASIEENVRSLGIQSVRLLQADFTEIKDSGTFDRILLDAPCSSTGVIRRNPDVRYRHTEKDIAAFGEKQTLFLNAAAHQLKKGGRLVYSVCSIDPLEGDRVVRDFLKTAGEFRIIEAERDFLAPFIKDGFFRTYPHKHAMDGFFGVILCKKA
jgi:16S rRNA (cytosine967-C5)-methyltransferase